MSQDVLGKLLENEGIDKFILESKNQIKDSYLYILGSYRKILGDPNQSYVLNSSFWEILKLHPDINSFFYAQGGQYLHFLEKPFSQNPVAKRIVEMILTMLKREFPEDF